MYCNWKYRETGILIKSLHWLSIEHHCKIPYIIFLISMPYVFYLMSFRRWCMYKSSYLHFIWYVKTFTCGRFQMKPYHFDFEHSLCFQRIKTKNICWPETEIKKTSLSPCGYAVLLKQHMLLRNRQTIVVSEICFP